MNSSQRVTLKPGDTIGILGGGQLGRMLALAAARLGLKCQIFSPDPDSPAFDVVQNGTCAEYADVEALELFAGDVDVVTYEFENVPAATAMVLAARRPVLPGHRILETVQDRLIEKNFVTGLFGMFNRKDTHVVINEKTLETAKTELRNRVQAVLQGLMQCTVQGLPLDTQELIELYYDTYNPDTATRQQLKDFDNMTADIVTKGEGHAVQPHLQGELS